VDVIETYRWWIFGVDGGPKLTAYHLTRSEAARLFPGATPNEATRTLRPLEPPAPLVVDEGVLRAARLARRCEAAGAEARFAGARRASNPFARTDGSEPIGGLTRAAREQLAAAWWRGWDGIA
jgi:hypothetical protein